MLTVLEILIIAVNIPVLIVGLLPLTRIPRFLDFLPSCSVALLVLHLLIDEAVRVRFVPLYLFTLTIFLFTMVRISRPNPDPPKRRIRAVLRSLFGLVALTASVLVPTVVLPFHSLPEPTGRFDVGTVVADFVDPNRPEAFSKDTAKRRQIAVQFWYPTDKVGYGTRPDINGAPVSTAQPTYPVLIFSHGAFGMRMSNASTFRELASHGYIVASIDHTYHSFYTSFSNGRGVPVNLKFLNEAMGAQTNQIPAEQVFTITHEWLNLRTDDIDLVIDGLKSGKVDSRVALLNRHMDLSGIGLFGHSLGGAAAAQVSRKRSDVKAAIVVDGTMIGDITGLSRDKKDMITDESFSKPLMLMYGSLYQDPEAKETSYLPNIHAFNHAAREAYAVCIMGSGHLNFTDLPRISPFLSKMLGVGTIDSFRCIQIVNAYTRAFFDQHIKGQPSLLLEGETPYREVELERRASQRRN